jgi:hypothetical protein
MKNDDSSFEMVDDFKRVGKTSTDHTSVHERKQRNSCYYLVQNFLSSRFYSKLRYTEI